MSTHSQDQFVELYTKEADAIFRFCLLRTSDREAAKDLVQETFSKIWKGIQAGVSYENPRAFAYKIARNLIIDWYRKKKAMSLDAMTDEDGNEEFVSIDENFVETIELGAEARYLISKIKELEEPYQHAVYLRFIEDLKPKEIAEILEEPVNTVSVRINRGIEKLKKITGYDNQNETK